MDGYWDHPLPRVSEAWRELLIEGEHTLPDGSTIRRGPYNSGYRIYPSGHPVFPGGELAPFPDFSSVYELLADDPRSFAVRRAEVSEPAAHAFLIDEAMACTLDPCPSFVDTTIRVGQPVVPPSWVSAALDRIERDWSNYVQGLDRYATAPAGYRLATVPALAGGYWTMQVPDEPPLIVETLCERCIEGAGTWQR